MDARLHPGFKATWCAALRSGTYRRGIHALCQVIGRRTVWCPLGVALDLTHDGDWILTGDLWFLDGQIAHPGLSQYRPWFRSGSDAEIRSSIGEVIILNDTGSSFSTTATWIGANL